MRILCFLLGLSVCPALSQTQPATAKVAIIIDDIGYQKADPELIRLPYALTFAVMPFTPNGDAMLQLARQYQKELMLHMPMEAVALNHLLGKGALRRQMSQTEVQQKLRAALQDVPGIKGVNNHMGSLYTTLLPQMDWVMEVVAAKGLYFIDSKTSGRSVVSQSAARFNIRHRSRDVFLDNDKSYAALDKQFQQLIVVAQQHGSAIAIGHPYPETYRYLRKNLPRLAAAGIELVPASHLLDLPESPHRQVQPEADPVELSAPAQHQTPTTAAVAAPTEPVSPSATQLANGGTNTATVDINTDSTGLAQPASPATAIAQRAVPELATPLLAPEQVVPASDALSVAAELPVWRIPLLANPSWVRLPDSTIAAQTTRSKPLPWADWYQLPAPITNTSVILPCCWLPDA